MTPLMVENFAAVTQRADRTRTKPGVGYVVVIQEIDERLGEIHVRRKGRKMFNIMSPSSPPASTIET